MTSSFLKNVGSTPTAGSSAVTRPPESVQSFTKSCWRQGSDYALTFLMRSWRSESMFLLIAVGIWACALLVWWGCTSAFRHSDIDRLKSRLLGASKTKKNKSAGPNAALIQAE